MFMSNRKARKHCFFLNREILIWMIVICFKVSHLSYLTVHHVIAILDANSLRSSTMGVWCLSTRDSPNSDYLSFIFTLYDTNSCMIHIQCLCLLMIRCVGKVGALSLSNVCFPKLTSITERVARIAKPSFL